MRTIVSIDIGGTRLRAAAYKQDQIQPISQKRVETKAKEPNAFGRLINLLEDIWPKNENGRPAYRRHYGHTKHKRMA